MLPNIVQDQEGQFVDFQVPFFCVNLVVITTKRSHILSRSRFGVRSIRLIWCLWIVLAVFSASSSSSKSELQLPVSLLGILLHTLSVFWIIVVAPCITLGFNFACLGVCSFPSVIGIAFVSSPELHESRRADKFRVGGNASDPSL